MTNSSIRVITVLFLLLGGCTFGLSDRSLVYVTPADAAILVREGESGLLGKTAPAILVDPRPSWSYRKAHIQGAVNVPFGQLRLHSWRFEDADIIIIAGDSYNDSAAMAMSKALLKLGFADVKILRGGLSGWEDAGEPIVTAD